MSRRRENSPPASDEQSQKEHRGATEEDIKRYFDQQRQTDLDETFRLIKVIREEKFREYSEQKERLLKAAQHREHPRYERTEEGVDAVSPLEEADRAQQLAHYQVMHRMRGQEVAAHHEQKERLWQEIERAQQAQQRMTEDEVTSYLQKAEQAQQLAHYEVATQIREQQVKGHREKKERLYKEAARPIYEQMLPTYAPFPYEETIAYEVLNHPTPIRLVECFHPQTGLPCSALDIAMWQADEHKRSKQQPQPRRDAWQEAVEIRIGPGGIVTAHDIDTGEEIGKGTAQDSPPQGPTAHAPRKPPSNKHVTWAAQLEDVAPPHQPNTLPGQHNLNIVHLAQNHNKNQPLFHPMLLYVRVLETHQHHQE